MCLRMPFLMKNEVFMGTLSAFYHYFTKTERLLWGCSVTLILLAYALFDRQSTLTLAASLIGVTSLIFTAKGNPVGQLLMVIFSLLYGLISWQFRYYGEMLTYVGMTMPMALFALIAWLRHPFQGRRSQVAVDRLRDGEPQLLAVLTAAVTVVFYFILRHFHTANLLPSTLSVTTSFAAVYLTFRRSPHYAVAYAMNDVVLILLWLLAARTQPRYLSVAVCFCAFLVNDLYGFLCWRAMEKRQRSAR